MLEHNCSLFCAVNQRLADEIRWLGEARNPQAVLSRREKERIYRTTMSLAEAEVYKLNFIEIGAETEVFRIQSLNGRLEGDDRFTHEVLKAELKHVQQDLVLRLMKLKFAYIPPPDDRYFEKERLFGDNVYEHFPSTRQDIKDAGNCLAAGLPTAAVFHLMRVSELALRILAKERSVSISSEMLDYKEWQPLIAAIEKEVEKLVANKPATRERSEAQNFYRGLISHFMGLKDVFRNNVCHVRDRFDEHQAHSAFSRVEEVMKSLAERISDETNVQPIVWNL